MNEYMLTVQLKGQQTYYVKAKSKEEAVDKILKSHKSVKIEDVEIDWNEDLYGLESMDEKLRYFINENIEEA